MTASVDKGDYPEIEICRLCVCVPINKRSCEPFMCLDQMFICLEIKHHATKRGEREREREREREKSRKSVHKR